MNISVNVIGKDQLIRNLKTFAANVEIESKAANAGTAIEILTDVRRTLSNVTPPRQFGADTGDLSGRYHVEVVNGGAKSAINAGSVPLLSATPSDPKSALVGAVSDHVLPVEFGRAPGSRPPPPGALTDWLVRHNLPPSLEYPIAQSIARRGIAALPHLHPAVEKARQRHLKNQTDGTKSAIKDAGANSRGK
ncbi:MAG: hypothetical protein E4H28_08405 [Gemmatimonadales bacterium]|nr:MAG: hypothetical protein E4H28_08405 [Gemmatimonadales bacterium]